jgi:hypothetical protein
MNTTKKKLCEAPKTDTGKQPYETPTLTIHGSVEDLTQSSFDVGSGDQWAKDNSLPDMFDC